jgi:hypothetical protein
MSSPSVLLLLGLGLSVAAVTATGTAAIADHDPFNSRAAPLVPVEHGIDESDSDAVLERLEALVGMQTAEEIAAIEGSGNSVELLADPDTGERLAALAFPRSTLSLFSLPH